MEKLTINWTPLVTQELRYQIYNFKNNLAKNVLTLAT